MRQRLLFNLMGSAVLFLSLLGQTSEGRAEIIVSSLEEAALASKLNGYRSYEGETGAASTFRSGNVAFTNDGVLTDSGFEFWSGIGYSQKGAPSAAPFWEQSNDLVAQPGVGANGSATWGVITSFGTLAADAGYVFDSLAIANTYWTWDTMVNGDMFAGPKFGNGLGTGRFEGQDDFFTVRFTNSDTNQFLDFNLADFRGGTDYIIEDWTNVDLSSLQASNLNVSFFGSRESTFDDTTYFLNTPAYAAIDNVAVSSSIAAVPEPSSLALMAIGSSAGMWFHRRKRRRSVQA